MSTLRPPSTSPSPSPAPGSPSNRAVGSRASVGATTRLGGGSPAAGQPASPRPVGFVGGSARPTSELVPGVNGNTAFQTPESEALDQWFENLQSYEATLEDMAAASLDVNFKEELSAIEQWFRVLSEAERTAALYSLLQHSTQVQIRFFITVLQQMARSDPMTAALMSPSMGKSMESQMESKMAQLGLKSPALKTPASPSSRNFSSFAKRQSLAVEPSSSFLSPDSAGLASGSDAAATLAAQRAKLNAAHRISAPPLAVPGDGRGGWSGQLGQVAEQSLPLNEGQELTIPAPNHSVRPKSTDFSGLANALSPRFNKNNDALEESALSPMVGKNWASMVNTPLVPMFQPGKPTDQNLDAVTGKLANWSMNGNEGANGRIMLEGADKFKLRRSSRSGSQAVSSAGGGGEHDVYDDNGTLLGQMQQQQQQARKTSVGGRGPLVGGHNNWPGATGARSPALSNTSGRFDDGTMNGLGVGVGGFNLGGMSPGLNMGMTMPGFSPLGVGGMPFDMNMLNMANLNLNGMNAMNMNQLNMNMSVQQQQLIAQMTAQSLAGYGGVGGMGVGQQPPYNRTRSSGRSPGQRPPLSTRDSGKSDVGEDFDPKLLDDIPAWLRSLRLHKYTPNFEGMKWKDMVLMDEPALEAKGVAALGARRKMLKTFEVVRNKLNFHPIDQPSVDGMKAVPENSEADLDGASDAPTGTAGA